jgi:tRNA wybutosine-synthesizing protein 2
MLLRVERRKAGTVMRKLLSLRLVDTGRRVVRKEGWVGIPVKAVPPAGLGELMEGESLPRKEQVPPYEAIRDSVRIPASLKPLLPDKWELLGKVLVLKLPKKLLCYRTELARAYGSVLDAKSVLLDRSGSRGVLREPTMELLLGNDTETVHLENSIRYSLDAARIMFSSGNMAERIRMGEVAGPGEKVVDMFAGIGYFTLPIAVHAKAEKVWACELNPVSFGYLVRNVKLNRVQSRVVPLEGDCRHTAPEGVADRVVMGHFDSAGFVPKALKVLRPEGGILHVHLLCPQKGIPDVALRPVLKEIQKQGKEANLLKCVRVKSFKPKVWHIVLDVAAKPA